MIALRRVSAQPKASRRYQPSRGMDRMRDNTHRARARKTALVIGRPVGPPGPGTASG